MPCAARTGEFSEWQILAALASGTATDAHLDQIVDLDGQELPVRDLSPAQLLALRERNAY